VAGLCLVLVLGLSARAQNNRQRAPSPRASPSPSLALPSPPAEVTAVQGVLGVVFVIVLVVGGVALYFLPTIIAVWRDHHNVGTIGVVNLFLGWSCLGWVVALAWSVSATNQRPE
jgi:hypothetical protein